jgi:hypothetical protein
MYVYIRTEPNLWTAGHYDPAGKFVPESDHGTPEEAAERVHYLNGGSDPEPMIPAIVRNAMTERFPKGETPAC